MLSRILVGFGSGIILLLGAIHLLYTFWGQKLTPRDSDLRTSMNDVAPVISNETTMWKAWVGFNASHSMGAILFGLIYGYLAVFEANLLFGSIYLTSVGVAMLVGLFLLGKKYWFNIPFTGISIALVCFLAGVFAWWL